MIKLKAWTSSLWVPERSLIVESRNPSEEGSLEDDQNRRDFTVNALAVSLNKQPLVTHRSIQRTRRLEKQIAHPFDRGDLPDDPLRMLRAIRFATQLMVLLKRYRNAIVQEEA